MSKAIKCVENGSCECGHHWATHNEFGCYVKIGSPSCDDAYCSCSLLPPIMCVAQREQRRLLAIKTPCRTHPRYQVIRRPRTACEGCWRMWLEVQR